MPISPMRVRSLYLKVVVPIVALVLAGMGVVWYFATIAMGESVRLVAAERARYGLAYVRSSVEDAGNRIMTDRGDALQGALERIGLSPDMDTVRPRVRKGFSCSIPSTEGCSSPTRAPSPSPRSEET